MRDLTAVCRGRRRTQAGLITRGQLRVAGLSVGQVEGLVRRRRLEVVARSLYRVAGEEVPPEQRAWVAVLSTGGRLIGEHLLALLGVEGGSFDGRPTVLIPEDSHPPRGLDAQLVRAALSARHHRAVAGLPAVALERAVPEYAIATPVRQVLRVVDSARWRGELRVPRLLATAADLGDHLGGQRCARCTRPGSSLTRARGAPAGRVPRHPRAAVPQAG